jgi:gamma-glutamylcyclotransferase (GGCT)/AIG2-like uncharacterized protein YtfP
VTHLVPDSAVCSLRRPTAAALQSGICHESTRWEKALLYFAYNARISPEEMLEVAPSAQFEFIAHLPEWGLDFPIANDTWGGSLPAVKPESGSTVWGAVYEISETDLAKLNDVEAGEQRAAQTIEAMDRNGRRHQVIVHLLDGDATTANGNGSTRPSADYLRLMVDGSKHWSLPFGWIAGLEEHLENA